MRQLSYRGGGALAVDEVPVPAPGPGEVRVRVHSVGLCTSDVYGYAQVNDRRDVVLGAGDVLVMGHEAVGTVEAQGGGVDGPAVGAIVAVNPIAGCRTCARCGAGLENLCERRTVYGCTPAAPGAYADTITVPAANAHPLPAGVPVEWGALVEPLTVGFHGVRLADPPPGASVLVVGGGIIGLGAALAARRRVGEQVLVLEPRPERRAVCAALGLQAVPPGDVLGTRHRFDLALDCVARPETFAGAVEAVGAGGEVVLVGIWADEIPLPVSLVVGRETRIRGSYGYSQADFADVAAWIGESGIDLAPIIERRVGFDELIGAFEAYADGSLTAVRTLLQPAR
ncbi:MAG: zinc-containing alcohol dehydrogenase [Solirubrobacterales bacterium]|jgi:threonine dehydrogenase-like Zn-dependent dehydrogenase|nr:zinc-containing alcohol dehydrogenase [Solirubrobacterales bacterium]